jgi:hypothetical protein
MIHGVGCMRCRWSNILFIPLLLGTFARGQYADQDHVRPLQAFANSLPEPVSENLDFEGWIWLSELQQSPPPIDDNFWDFQLSLAVTKSFNQRIAFTFQGNFIDADDEKRAELQQGFVSARLFENHDTLLTVGKFNANFGVEARDPWNRVTGTTSLLFAAQPQDLIGFMITQPLGQSGITLKPFMSADFQGAWNFDQSPSGGLVTEYQPNRNLKLSWTNWVGPGFVLFGGKELRSPYPKGGYGGNGGEVVENWQGPNLTAESGSTLYFTELAATWRIRPDLTLSGEYLLGTTGTSYGYWGWSGVMVMADYSINDRTHVWGRYSWLDDSDWLITGIFQTCQEVDCGIGWEIVRDVELRFEYRHDFSNFTPDFDSISAHLLMSF